MNKLWHSENKMPPSATLEQRIQWHNEHQKHCACRPAPKSLVLARPDLFRTATSSRISPPA
ncbi:MAG: hypothetical protein ABSG00_00250 [Terracidiphilus sp.]